jgi:predicted alpha/beta hydrolase family esterase
MPHLVLLHGMDATSDDQWVPSIKTQFEERGWKVDALDIPDSDNPALQHWLQHFNEQVTLTEDSVLVGHSMGCPVILSVIEVSKIKLKKAILVAGFVEPIVDAVTPILPNEYNWSQIKANCAEFVFINSDNDPYDCTDKQGRIMMDNLGGTQIIMSGEGHFGTSEFNQPYPEFPLLIKLIED